ncbi:hypothetical protein LguiB_007407 [Lonicera macranthoides]
MKCVGLQYLEAIPKLKNSGFVPVRDVYLSFVPDEEIGGHDGAEKFVQSEVFDEMNAGIVLDKGLATPGEEYSVPKAGRSNTLFPNKYQYVQLDISISMTCGT